MDDTTINILDQEAEASPAEEHARVRAGGASPEQELANIAPGASEAPAEEYQPGDGLAEVRERYREGEASLAPFEGAADPGLENADELGEGEEAPAAPEPIVYREFTPDQLQAAVEAAIFMQQKPITVSRIRELINPNIDEEEYRTAISNLMATYFEETRGIELVEVANGFQLRTKAENKDIIRRMYQIAPMKLTNAMLEVLAIVAYNQPVTREGVDKIRGVDSSHLLRVLLDKKMLRIAGKSDTVGNPMIYATTKEFLELFGLRDLSALPTLRELEEMLPKNEVGSISEEEALSQEMEGIVSASKPIDFNDLELEGWDPEEEKRDLLGADEAGPKGPSWRERLKAKKAEEKQAAEAAAAAPQTDLKAEEAPAAEAIPTLEMPTLDESIQLETNELQAQQEVMNDEQPQTIENQEAAPAGENRDGGEALDGGSQEGAEAFGDADLPPEIARRITPGQEGNA